MEYIQITKKDYNSCVSSFQYIFLSNNITDEIKNKCLKGEADKENIRPTAWKFFLNILPNNNQSSQVYLLHWIESISHQRANYKKIKAKYLTTKNIIGDPLGVDSQQKANATPIENQPSWDSYYKDNDTKRLIGLDLIRTFQEISLFHQSPTISLLSNILFIWAKENSDLSYRQGMNELLALIYITFYPYYFNKSRNNSKYTTKADLIKYTIDNPKQYSNDLYNFFHDESELEADVYFAFSNLMKKGMKALYTNKEYKGNSFSKEERDAVISQYQLFQTDWLNSEDKEIPSHLYIRSSLIIKEKLRAVDDDLCCHFKYFQLDTYAALQRWLKCIFIREFDYKDCCVLWDIILAKQNSEKDKYDLMFIDYITIAMIIRIRRQLLNGDENDCITLLFKYPHVDDLLELVSFAEKIKVVIEEKIKGNQMKLGDVLMYQSNLKQAQSSKSTKTPIPITTENDKEANKRLNGNSIINSNNNTQVNTVNDNHNADPVMLLFNNAWSSVGGYLTDITTQVSKTIEKAVNEDIFNIGITPFTNPSPSSSSVNKTQIENSDEAIKRLEHIYFKYQSQIETGDLHKFATAISYLKMD